MANYRLQRLTVYQPVIGADPQRYVYDAELVDTTSGAPLVVQVIPDTEAPFEALEICQAITDSISPDTLNWACS